MTPKEAAAPPWSEHLIVQAFGSSVLLRKCILVVDRCSWTGNECDVLGVTTDRRVIDVEVKISRADFRADASKEKWWHRHYGPYVHGTGQEITSERRDWPRRVWKHYFVMPASIWSEDLVASLPSPNCGVVTLDQYRGSIRTHLVRRPRPNPDAYRLTDVQVLDVARLANLRLWDAYGAIERYRLERATA